MGGKVGEQLTARGDLLTFQDLQHWRSEWQVVDRLVPDIVHAPSPH